MEKTVLIIGTLDTKAKELGYLRDRIRAEGLQTLLMDVGCKSCSPENLADISCETVAEAGGKAFEEIAGFDKGPAVQAVTDGAAKLVTRFFEQGKIHGVIGLGGANGAEIACAAMRMLPIGFPKLMVTCVASGNTRPYVGTKDIIMANSIGDISLNRITKMVIANAARAVSHMAKAEPFHEEVIKPQICISTFGTTLPCVERAKDLLERDGYEVIELHASGTGGMALEELVLSGEISGVLDITTSELVDDLVDGIYSAGPGRLEAASKMAVPQVISLGALDFGNFGPKETVPPRYKDRSFFFYAPSITLMRTNEEESRILGERIAQKASMSTGPTAVIIPLKGFSALDREGGKQMVSLDGKVTGEWHDKAANQALIDSIRSHLDLPRVTLKEVDAHINDSDFADAAVQLLLLMMREKGKDAPQISKKSGGRQTQIKRPAD
jgi:uncharacterized protein (UPF0261 family)